MNRKLLFTIVALALVVGGQGVSHALPRDARVELYRGNLNFPVDMAWAPGTRTIFFTEKDSGRVRVMSGRRLLATPCVDLRVNSEGERGALGITLHPNFRRNRWLYVYYTNAFPLENRVTRFRVVNNRCTRPVHVVRGITTTSGYHNGGQLEFVGGKLFVSTGESHTPALAQSVRHRGGKILRYNPDGSIPSGNPFGRNPVWSYGLRNPFGLARKPGTSLVYATDNGPSCDDELNRIVRGRNYGWGAGYRCGTAGVGRNPTRPMRRWATPIVPTDAWWYTGPMRSLANSLYFGDYRRGRLHRFVLDSSGTRIRAHRIAYDTSSAIVDVGKGPGGWLYFMTPRAIYRVVRVRQTASGGSSQSLAEILGRLLPEPLGGAS